MTCSFSKSFRVSQENYISQISADENISLAANNHSTVVGISIHFLLARVERNNEHLGTSEGENMVKATIFENIPDFSNGISS